MKIIFDRNNCIGCGVCTALCPKYWEMGEDNKSTLKDSKENFETGNFELEILGPSEEDKKNNQEAADSCPVQVIKISE